MKIRARISDDAAEQAGITTEPGWVGWFTRRQAPEAIHPNGTRVYKVNSRPGDDHQDGAPATVLGSVHVPGHGCGYFVEWADRPKEACLTTGIKLMRRS